MCGQQSENTSTRWSRTCVNICAYWSVCFFSTVLSLYMHPVEICALCVHLFKQVNSGHGQHIHVNKDQDIIRICVSCSCSYLYIIIIC